jgi:prepilin-type processing-associated H-X9-DG protein
MGGISASRLSVARKLAASCAIAETLEKRALLAASVTSLTLINADSEQPVTGFSFVNGATVDLALVGKRLNVRADMSGEPVASVRFNYDANPGYKIETGAPYALAGNSGQDYFAWTPALGTHTLVATPYEKAVGTGGRGVSRAITFTVIDSSAPPAPVRINAGGSSFKTGDGRAFAADTNFSGGTKSSGTFSVAGTHDDTLYRTRREGSSFTFSKSVPTGAYLLTLHFAEPTKTARGQRKFDVSAEGKLLLNDYDVYAAGGAKAAVARTFSVPVNDGRIDLSFKGVVSSAIVSAVEVVAAPRTVAVPAPVWINAGGERFTDSLNRTFEADSGFAGGAKSQSVVYDVLLAPSAPQQFAHAYADDPLLLDYRSGANFTFSRPIANGNYTVWLEFAEPVAGTTAGQRVFDVSAEGSLVLNDYDIVADAGAAGLAISRTFDANVKDGQIDLSFNGVFGDALVSAIVIVPTDIPAVALPYAGVQSSADPVKAKAYDDVRQVRSASNLRLIGMAIQMYANENKGKYPPNLAALLFNGGIEHPVFSSPRAPSALAMPRGELSQLEQVAWVEASRDYVYVGAGLNFRASKDTWVTYENPDQVQGESLCVLFGDGHVSYMPREEVIARYGGSLSGPTIVRPIDTITDPKVNASAANLRQISQGLFLWSNENKAKFPPNLGSLYFDLAPETFINPRGSTTPPPADWTDEQKIAWINASTDYLYLAAGQSRGRFHSQNVLVHENAADLAGGINLLFGDGHVEFREMRWALESIARPRP